MAPPRSRARFKARVLEGSKAGDYPGFVPPQLATRRRQVPPGDRRFHEITFDGYRIQAHLVKGRAHLYTRTGLDCTVHFPPIADGIESIKANHVIIDGELVCEVKGRPSLSALERDLSAGRTDRMVYVAFDLLFIDGFDLRGVKLIDRRNILTELLAESPHPRIVYGEHGKIDGNPR